MDVLVDLRCLQDPHYQQRGIGVHLKCLLRSRRETQAANCRLTGLTQPTVGELPGEVEALCDGIAPTHQLALARTGVIFVDPSPMTHDSIYTAHLTGHVRVLKASCVYDFIPVEREGYFANAGDRIEYFARLGQLRRSNLFFPISSYTARRLRELLSVPEAAICVTGAGVRASFYELRSGDAPHPRPNRFNHGNRRPYFLTVGGGDARKNSRLAVEAVRSLREQIRESISLRLVGTYEEAAKEDLLQVATTKGDWPFVEFHADIPDAELCELYSGALATVVPSLAEGFSLPVAESVVCGTPAIVSACEAHQELIDDPEALFPPDAPEQLAVKLRFAWQKPSFRERLWRRQWSLAERFHEKAVGQRFWNRVVEEAKRRFGNRRRAADRSKPRVAILSPYPPDKSGVARYTQRTITAAKKHWDITLFSNADRPLAGRDGFADGGEISVRAFVSNQYDCVISVIGNSAFHLPIMALHNDFGGPTILHDSRLTQVYHQHLGRDAFMEFARRLLRRSVSHWEIDAWLEEQEGPSLFVERIADRASPLIVHTERFREILKQKHGYEAELAPFCPNMEFSPDELSPQARREARERLGIKDEFVIATFGFVDVLRKGHGTCIAAIDHLRAWGVPAVLYFVGRAGPEQQELVKIARHFEVEEYVHFHSDFVSSRRYRDFLVAADAAVQLRNYGLGQASAALADCISAGLPTVATEDLAASCDAPSYVRRIPDYNSPLLVAEYLADIQACGARRSDTADQRREYCEEHNFDRYVERLNKILGLD